MLATPPLADLFETEGSNSEATKCKLKIAEFSGELGAYKRAVEIYEEAAKAAVENNLLKFSARGYLLNAGICYLCYCRWGGVRAAQQAGRAAGSRPGAGQQAGGRAAGRGKDLGGAFSLEDCIHTNPDRIEHKRPH